VNRLRRLLPDGNSTLEAGAAAAAGFLAGQTMHGDWWTQIVHLVQLLFGN
jgi:hypothetical protein